MVYKQLLVREWRFKVPWLHVAFQQLRGQPQSARIISKL
jgi:hypothetical protein